MTLVLCPCPICSGQDEQKAEDELMTEDDEVNAIESAGDDDHLFDDPTGELPPSLVKATCDPFDYAMGLRDGRVIHFMEARLVKGGKWIELIGFGGYEREGGDGGSIEMSGVEYHFPRGLDVRLSDIMWVADAPNGS